MGGKGPRRPSGLPAIPFFIEHARVQGLDDTAKRIFPRPVMANGHSPRLLVEADVDLAGLATREGANAVRGEVMQEDVPRRELGNAISIHGHIHAQAPPDMLNQ